MNWKSKKQTVVARSSAEAEYQVMAHTSCELTWMRHLSEELCFDAKLPMSMYCDNQAVIYVASNPVFHERTKHIEVDCHLIREGGLRRVSLLHRWCPRELSWLICSPSSF